MHRNPQVLLQCRLGWSGAGARPESLHFQQGSRRLRGCWSVDPTWSSKGVLHLFNIYRDVWEGTVYKAPAGPFYGGPRSWGGSPIRNPCVYLLQTPATLSPWAHYPCMSQCSAPSRAVLALGVSTMPLFMPDAPASLSIGVTPPLLPRTGTRAEVCDSRASAHDCLAGASLEPQRRAG